jgi:hypothetical protein
MAYAAQGHERMQDGPSIGSGIASVKKMHFYVTNDDRAAVETNGYFDTAAERFQTGDIIFCSMDLDGTPAFAAYGIVRTAGDIALTRFVDLIE